MDLFLFQKINQLAGKWICLDTIAIFFAKYFEYILIFCLLLFLVKNLKKYWPMILPAFLAAILARFVIVEIIRYFFPRPRPFLELQINSLLFSLSNSFPSGHAAFYFALSTVIYSYNKKTGLLFFLASFLIAISRVFIGLHWPSDILAGAGVGIFTGWLIILFFQRLFPTAAKQ